MNYSLLPTTILTCQSSGTSSHDHMVAEKGHPRPLHKYTIRSRCRTITKWKVKGQYSAADIFANLSSSACAAHLHARTIDIRGFTGLETPNELHNRGALTDICARACSINYINRCEKRSMVAEKGHPRPLRKYLLPPAVSTIPPAVPPAYRPRYPRLVPAWRRRGRPWRMHHDRSGDPLPSTTCRAIASQELQIRRPFTQSLMY